MLGQFRTDDENGRTRPADEQKAEPAVVPAASEQRHRVEREWQQQRVFRMKRPGGGIRTGEECPVYPVRVPEDFRLESPDCPEIPFPWSSQSRERRERGEKNKGADISND